MVCYADIGRSLLKEIPLPLHDSELILSHAETYNVLLKTYLFPAILASAILASLFYVLGVLEGSMLLLELQLFQFVGSGNGKVLEEDLSA